MIEPADRARFLQLKAGLDGTADVVMLPYHTAFDTQGRPVFTYYRERLLRRAAGLRWQGAVHECIAPAGQIVYGDAAVSHRKADAGHPSRRNLDIYERLRAQGETLDARACFYYARELMADGQDETAARVFEDFLARTDGWVENRIEACRNLADCLVRLGRRDQAKQALVRSFAMDCPRGETCCALAALALQEGELEQAAFWYRAALQAPCHPERADLCTGPVMILSRASDCACAATAWGSMSKPQSGTSARRWFSRMRPKCVYNRCYFAGRQADSDRAANQGIE